MYTDIFCIFLFLADGGFISIFYDTKLPFNLKSLLSSENFATNFGGVESIKDF